MTFIQMIMTFVGFGGALIVICAIIEGIPSKHSQKIEFNHFVNLYVINPDRWELDNSFVSFIKPADGMLRWKETILFQFNFIDYYRYRYWKHNLEKQKRQQKACKELQEVISVLRADLEKFEKKNASTMNAAAKEIDIIVEGLKDDGVKACELIQKTLHTKYGAATATINFHNPFGAGPQTREKTKEE